ncbi:MAG: LEA type 2 family protein [Bacteroidota bacterium]|nr:LEA type 2 family protein [Bacteroidota bacterium]
MKKVIKYIAISILSLVVIVAVFTFTFRKKIAKRIIPEVTQQGIIHVEVENDTSIISAILLIRNKTFLKIHIDTIKYGVSLFNKSYLNRKEFLGISLPGYGSDSIHFELKIPYALLLKDLKAERKKDDSAGYSINVSLQYAIGLWKSEMPINKSGKLKIPQPPEIQIEEVNWKRIRMRSLLADVRIKIINHSPIALSIKEVEYFMKVSDQGSLKGKYKAIINIKPNGITFINVPIKINTNHPGITLFQILANKDKYIYALNMQASMESVGPEKLSFDLDLNKTGTIELRK